MLSTGNFSDELWSVHSCFPNMLTLLSFLLCISHGDLPVAVTFWTVHVRGFGATCNFLLWDTDKLCFCLFVCFFHISVPPPSLSKSRLEPDKGLMRLEFIRQWVGNAPWSPLTTDCWLPLWGNKTLFIFCSSLCVHLWLPIWVFAQ